MEFKTEAPPPVKIRDEMQAFMDQMKARGVLMLIQYANKDEAAEGAERGAFIGTMPISQALGCLETHKVIVIDGLKAHQSFDGMVQAMEARPDLVDRYINVMHNAARCEEHRDVKEPVKEVIN